MKEISRILQFWVLILLLSPILVFGQIAQTINFPNIADQVVGNPAVTLMATASSGLTVTYAVEGPASLAGNELSLDGFGVVKVVANQAGNASFLAAEDVTRYFLIERDFIETVTHPSCYSDFDIKALVLGSSTAWGAGSFPREDNAWAYIYEDYLQGINPINEVVNIASPGLQSSQILPTGADHGFRPGPETDHNVTHAISQNPNYILINLPSNDANSGYTAEETVGNLITIFNEAAAAGIPMFVTSTQPRNFDTAKIAVNIETRDLIYSVFGEYAINFWDPFAQTDGTINPTYNADGTHLNNAGHSIMMQKVIDENILGKVFTPTQTAIAWYADSDGDGYGDINNSIMACSLPGFVSNSDDCNDNDETIFPGATEIADDGIDQDCDGSDLIQDGDGDGVLIGVDCDDNDAAIGAATVWYRDNDGDSYGDLNTTQTACLQPTGFVADNTDCDDTSNTVFPGATEISDDGIDQDCDGSDLIQDGDGDGVLIGVDCDDNDAAIGVATVWYRDFDGDTFGDLNTTIALCNQPEGYVADNTDCDDTSNTIFPGATEIADDGIDQDCDGSDLIQDGDGDGVLIGVDCDDNDAAIGVATVWYRDNDGDTFGDLNTTITLCNQPEGYVADNTDCDDTSNTVFPGATEIADDGIDQDCDGSDLIQDGDGDGVLIGVDCDDNDAAIGVATVWYRDNDGDSFGDLNTTQTACLQPTGFVADNTDCDDTSNTIFPGATEIADDGIDQDCDGSDLIQDGDSDGVLVGVDCDDTDPAIGVATVWYRDNDGDTFGDLNTTITLCNQPEGYVADNTDCDDTSNTIFPGATEIADDGIDQDCDGSDLVQDADGDGIDATIDCDDTDAAIGVATVWYRDNDGDTFGDLNTTITLCNQPEGYVADNTDCDDTSNTIFPGATEIADDGIDQDCDGSDLVQDADGDGINATIDCDDNDAAIGAATVWYRDNDGDTFGDLNTTQTACLQPEGYVADNTDCDDTSNTIFPGATEIADDGIDQDCDGSDLVQDGDGDGIDATIDCDDNDAAIGVATVWYRDFDGDTFGDLNTTITLCNQPEGYVADNTDCDDTSNTIFPGATEIADDGIDQDCDGSDLVQDADGDGVDATIDCDDTDPAIGVATVWYADTDGDGFGDLNTTQTACLQPEGYVADNTDCDDTSNTIFPGATEIADDGIDQDCDGSDLVQDGDGDGIDATIDCDDNDAAIGAATVWYRDNDADTFGDLNTTQTTCLQPAGYVANNTDCDDTSNTVFPGATEIADDGIDQDCDGSDLIQDGDGDGIDATIDCDDNDAAIGVATVWYRDNDGDTFGDLNTTITLCNQPEGYVADNTDCDDTSNTVFPGATEIADDGIDQDCDGSDLVQDGDGDGIDATIDCDDTDAAIGVATVWYRDNDGDTFGDLNTTQTACLQPVGYVADNTDCDDTLNTVFPGATEIADDGIDQDCDGSDLVQDGDGDGIDANIDCDDNDAAIGAATVWYRDNDGDTFGDLNTTITLCNQPVGYVADNTDCDDTSNTVFPGATEIADDGIDQDCDGSDLVLDADGDGIDATIDCDDTDAAIGVATVWYRDNDGDTFGDLNTTQTACLQPTGYVADNTDCDDTSNTVFPGANGDPVCGGSGNEAKQVLYRINAGSSMTIADTGLDWAADSKSSPVEFLDPNSSNHTTGWDYNFQVNSTDAPSMIFGTQRISPGWGGGNVIYDFPVSTSGTYEVQLFFAEKYNNGPAVGGRKFGVEIEGNRFLDQYDIKADIGDKNTTVKSFQVQVADGNVTVEFITQTGFPTINGIQVCKLGNVSQSNFAPSIASIDDQNNFVGDTPNLTIIASDEDDDNLTFVATGLPSGLSINNDGVVSGQIQGAVGTYEVSVTVTDDGTPNLNSTRTFKWKILTIPTNSAPVLQVIPNQNDEVHEFRILEFSFSDPDGDEVTFSASGYPTGLELKAISGKFRGTLTEVGTFNVTVTATDNGNPNRSTTRTFVWTVVDPDVQGSGQVVYRINAGGVSIADSDGEWNTDKRSSPHSTFATGPNATTGWNANFTSNTTDAPNTLFGTQRYSWGGNFGYVLPVENGTYEIDLYFSEKYNASTVIGERKFAVDLEGSRVLDQYDVISTFGKNKAGKESFQLIITDGEINLDIIRQVGDPMISGIQVKNMGIPQAVPEFEKLAANHRLLIYPNPSTDGRFTLEYVAHEDDEEVEVLIYDNAMRLVKRIVSSTNTGAYQIELNLDAAAGMYLVKLNTASNPGQAGTLIRE